MADNADSIGVLGQILLEFTTNLPLLGKSLDSRILTATSAVAEVLL